jgi:hypothetical protein
MATHDYVIANGTGAAVRSDLNNALAAIVSNNSSSSEPGTTYAYQWWADTNANLLKLRNSSNDGWITLSALDGTILIPDGNASSPGISFRDDTNTGMFSGAADQIGFATGGAERLEIGSSEVVFNDPSNDVDFRVESNGNTHMLFVDAGNDRVGLGTDAPARELHLHRSDSETVQLHITNSTTGATSNDGFSIALGSDETAILNMRENNDMRFFTNDSEAARIDSSGRLLVGTSSARTNVLDGDGGNTLTPQFQFETANSDTAKALSVIFGRNNTNGAEIVLGKHRSASVGGTTIVNDGDQLGSLTFSGSDGTNFIPAATIEANVDATPGSNDMPGSLRFSTTADGASSPSERMRLTSDGKLGINQSTPQFGLTIGQTSDDAGKLGWEDGSENKRASITCSSSSDDLQFHTGTSDSERMRITSGGRLLIGKTTFAFEDAGHLFGGGGDVDHVRDGNTVMFINRLSNDGGLVNFYQAGSLEGSISVSGSTVSYNGGHLARWSQLPSGAERTEILRGSVLSNLDEMCEWAYETQDAVLYTEEDELPEGVSVGDVKTPAVAAGTEDNEQLNRMKVSDLEGDVNVAGVFQAWDDDDDTYTNDFYCAMTGDFVIRIAQGTTVARGDLLMSAGDGTAKPQDDDIVRSKTIAKVTSTTVSTTYSDGSYCVPCVLMAC